MKHVVTMEYWLINDGTFRCGVWMISIWLRSIIPYHFYSSYTHFGMTSFTKVPSSFVWPSLWLVKYWWGDSFWFGAVVKCVFGYVFQQERWVLRYVFPWSLGFFGGYEMKIPSSIDSKNTSISLGGWRNTLKCCMQFRISWPMPDACLLGNSLLLGFLLDLYWIQGREYLRKLGHCQLRWMWSFQQRLVEAVLAWFLLKWNFPGHNLGFTTQRF